MSEQTQPNLLFCSNLISLSVSVLWKSCDTTICSPRRLNIQCNPNSRILITNVQSGVSEQYDALSYSNLRRSCLGMNRCNASAPNVFCQNHERTSDSAQVVFNVSYVCVKGNEMLDLRKCVHCLCIHVSDQRITMYYEQIINIVHAIINLLTTL